MFDDAIMAAKPVQVSVDETLLARIDADPEAKRVGRSAFIRAAVELYLQARRRRDVDALIHGAYDSEADAMLEEIEELMGGQAWPEA
jgi:metal-responsive CopG/Arc/MetJ family transcriptional regulator